MNWDMCLEELFLNKYIRSAAADNDLAVLQRGGIKSLVDQLHDAVKKGNFIPNILQLLETICTPGGRTDRKIQDLVLEMVVGRRALPDSYKKLKL